MHTKDIDNIVEHLNRLTLQQEQLTQQIAALQNELRIQRREFAQANTRDASQATQEPASARARKRRPITVGDRVRIKNPGKNSSCTGTVDSYTLSRLFVRIHLDNSGPVINRAPSNLVRIEP